MNSVCKVTFQSNLWHDKITADKKYFTVSPEKSNSSGILLFVFSGNKVRKVVKYLQ